MRACDDQLVDPPAETREVAQDTPTQRPAHAKRGVLVVDDENLVRVMVQLGLEQDGFDVYLASDGREAIQLYRKHLQSIDIVLLDVRMPGLDGPQTLDALRQVNPRILVCLMSGDTGAYRLDDLRRRGAADFIAKPFGLDYLAGMLRRLIDGVADEVLSDARCQG